MLKYLKIFVLLLAIFANTPVSAANFYWKASTTDLNAIAAPSSGDRGIVITDAGVVSYWIYNGSAWVQAYSAVASHNQAETTITFTDVITGNASTSAHGFLPKLPGNTTTFLRGDGAFAAPSGSGDVTGPASSTDNAIARFDSTTGKIIQNSSATIDDSGNISAPSFNSTAADGSRKIVVTNNTSITPSASSMELYPEGDAWKINQNGTEYSMPVIIASGTSALGTTQIASGACASIVTTAASGVATTDVIQWGFNTRPTQVTGYAGANTTGALRIDAYPTANNVNFEVCNQTASAITPGAMTLNWRVTR